MASFGPQDFDSAISVLVPAVFLVLMDIEPVLVRNDHDRPPGELRILTQSRSPPPVAGEPKGFGRCLKSGLELGRCRILVASVGWAFRYRNQHQIVVRGKPQAGTVSAIPRVSNRAPAWHTSRRRILGTELGIEWPRISRIRSRSVVEWVIGDYRLGSRGCGFG